MKGKVLPEGDPNKPTLNLSIYTTNKSTLVQ